MNSSRHSRSILEYTLPGTGERSICAIEVGAAIGINCTGIRLLRRGLELDTSTEAVRLPGAICDAQHEPDAAHNFRRCFQTQPDSQTNQRAQQRRKKVRQTLFI